MVKNFDHDHCQNPNFPWLSNPFDHDQILSNLEGANIEPVEVSQSSTYTGQDNKFGPHLAIDGYIDTNSHTNCGSNIDIWFKMRFKNALTCFRDIVLIQAAMNRNHASRMDGTAVWVVNTKTGSEYLCGLLKTGNVYTVEGQTYKIPCSMKCGDEVKVTVRGKSREACIYLREINAFGISEPGLFKIRDPKLTGHVYIFISSSTNHDLDLTQTSPGPRPYISIATQSG